MKDYFVIYNNMAEDIFIETEYWEEPEDIGFAAVFERRFGDLGIDVYLYKHAALLKPNKQMALLSFAPQWHLTAIDGRSPYEFLRAIPVFEKIRSVVKLLKITNEKGDLLFTLEDAREEDLTIKPPRSNSIDYILEISVRQGSK
jgi:hypothetical protein